MPLACFKYYVHAYVNYLLSDKSAGDSDGANCFFVIVELRHRDICGGGHELQRCVVEVLERLRAKQLWYDATPEIYGDFTEMADKAIKVIEE